MINKWLISCWKWSEGEIHVTIEWVFTRKYLVDLICLCTFVSAHDLEWIKIWIFDGLVSDSLRQESTFLCFDSLEAWTDFPCKSTYGQRNEFLKKCGGLWLGGDKVSRRWRGLWPFGVSLSYSAAVADPAGRREVQPQGARSYGRLTTGARGRPPTSSAPFMFPTPGFGTPFPTTPRQHLRQPLR